MCRCFIDTQNYAVGLATKCSIFELERSNVCLNVLPTALKIHVSPWTKELLDKFGTFKLTLRGKVEMKASNINKEDVDVL